MVLADLGLIDFIFLTTGTNPDENVRKQVPGLANKRKIQGGRPQELASPASPEHPSVPCAGGEEGIQNRQRAAGGSDLRDRRQRRGVPRETQAGHAELPPVDTPASSIKTK